MIYAQLMSEGRGRSSGQRAAAKLAAVPTVERIVELLRGAAPGARELDEKLKRVFRLSEGQASLRLK
jgi:hypothetical protein